MHQAGAGPTDKSIRERSQTSEGGEEGGGLVAPGDGKGNKPVYGGAGTCHLVGAFKQLVGASLKQFRRIRYPTRRWQRSALNDACLTNRRTVPERWSHRK